LTKLVSRTSTKGTIAFRRDSLRIESVIVVLDVVSTCASFAQTRDYLVCLVALLVRLAVTVIILHFWVFLHLTCYIVVI